MGMPVGSFATAPVVATQLKDLADHPALISRKEELHSLADALQGVGDGDVEPWTELDLLQFFCRKESLDATVTRRPEHRVWAYLEAGIGALVFLPLLLTWFGLSRATSAYEALIGEDPKAAGRPFLQLWQSGFEGRMEGWSTFGHVAGSATAVILLLFVLTVVHGARRARADQQAEAAQRAADDLLARLAPVLTKAQLLLNERRLTSPQRFTAELTGAAAALGKLLNKAVRAHGQLETAATAVADAVQHAGKQLAEVDAAVRPLEKAVGRVETAVRTSTDEMGKAVSALADPFDKSSARLESAVSGSGAMVRQALEDVRTVNGEVRDALTGAGDRVEDSVTVLAAAQRSFATGTELAADVSGQVLNRLGDVTERTADAVAASQRAVLGLAEQTGALRQAAERFAELAEVLSRGVPAQLAGPAQVPGSAPVPGSAGAVDLAKASDGDRSTPVDAR
ncbi:methyl-accepting chemotaxis protein [Streptomyces sp. NPDC059874]|uniref:methyl-accepting chemotaxis protein n=1 Tax=Streptomyces sp. NPDC059874 TaxID=3346983 RepID=UPI00365A559F